MKNSLTVFTGSVLIVLLCQLSTNIAVAQQSCDDQTLMNIKGSWKKRTDANMANNQVQAVSHIDAISNLFKMAYPEPNGMEAGWYRTMGGNPVISNGPIPYQFNSLYLGWYCDNYLHKVVLGDETGTWAYAFVNGFSWFMSKQYDLLLIKVDGQDVYILPPVKGEWKGYPMYQSSSHRDKGRCIILTHNNQLPWKPITQEQYLQALKNYWGKQMQTSVDNYNQREGNYKKVISDVQNNKYLKQPDKDKMIAGIQKDEANFLKTKDEDIAKSNKFWNDRFSIIDKYVNKNSALLQQPAIIDQQNTDDFKGNFSTLEKGGQLLVTVNSTYFNSALPRYAAQMIVLYWRWDNTAPGLSFKKQFEDNFPVDKLKAMIDK